MRILLVGLWWVGLSPVLMATEASSTVGREGALSVVLAQPALQALPAEPRAALVVRIAEREVVPTGTRYDLRFIGAVPGSYDLGRHLVDVEGRPRADTAPITVHVHALLPPGVPGDLLAGPAPAPVRFGGYQLGMLVAGLAWLALLPLWWRRQRRPEVPAPEVRASLAEQLRALIDRARGGGLDTQAQATLERLLLAHWRGRLGLQHLDAPTAMAQLRAHPQAGALLRQLDGWLHARPGQARVDVAALLAPYHDAPAIPSASILAAPRS